MERKIIEAFREELIKLSGNYEKITRKNTLEYPYMVKQLKDAGVSGSNAKKEVKRAIAIDRIGLAGNMISNKERNRAIRKARMGRALKTEVAN